MAQSDAGRVLTGSRLAKPAASAPACTVPPQAPATPGQASRLGGRDNDGQEDVGRHGAEQGAPAELGRALQLPLLRCQLLHIVGQPALGVVSTCCR